MNQLRRLVQSLSIQIIVDIFIYIALSVPVLVYIGGVKPRARGFFCDDQSLQYPYTPDSISTGTLILAGLTASLFLVIISEGSKWLETREQGTPVKTFLCYVVKGYICLMFGAMINECVVKGIKQLTGRLRPNFFDICKPDFASINCSQGYIADYVCTSQTVSPTLLIKSQTSFPSGHASFSMYVAVFCVFYLHERFTFSYSRFLRPLLQSGCVLVALLCSVTRINDNMHHVSDVVFGSSTGLIIASFMFITVAKPMLVKHHKNTSQQSGNVMTDPVTPMPLLSQESPWTCREVKSDYNDIPNGKLPI
ncbi:hypothetical protein ScPMuIL_006638 [Solemya velum]